MLNKKLIQFKKYLRRLFKDNRLYTLLASTQPISNLYGLDRGEAIDRFYIENFLNENKKHITGNCLELLNNDYTKKYGHEVVLSDILDINTDNKKATIFGDIKNLDKIPDNKYDCIILTQVLQFIDNYDLAIGECYRVLKKDGILLVTVPSISRIDCISGTDSDFWRFTTASAKYIFKKHFNDDQITVNSYGNAIASAKFLLGFSQEEVTKNQLEYNDQNFPLLVTVKACKI